MSDLRHKYLEDHLINEFLENLGVTYEIGPCAARDQHGNEYESLIVPFNGDDSLGWNSYKKSLSASLKNHVHVIWRIAPQVESNVGGGSRIYSRFSRYPVRP